MSDRLIKLWWMVFEKICTSVTIFPQGREGERGIGGWLVGVSFVENQFMTTNTETQDKTVRATNFEILALVEVLPMKLGDLELVGW